MSEEYYQNGKLQGEVRLYNKDANLGYIDTYDRGVKIKRKGFDVRGKMEFEQTY